MEEKGRRGKGDGEEGGRGDKVPHVQDFRIRNVGTRGKYSSILLLCIHTLKNLFSYIFNQRYTIVHTVVRSRTSFLITISRLFWGHFEHPNERLDHSFKTITLF